MAKLKFYLPVILILVLLICLPTLAEAQCPMCRMTAESNLANGGTEGQGLNRGILYMLATPYLFIGLLAYLWWRNRKKEGELEMDAE
ncbi:MAG: hypothetical protein DA408_06245 [Bacteroidetes bacterium]|nr:MAG: hypothetical protein C7N36_21860 [Bacteroidota bacterium]PTM13583.1 MAG: hypothetical protein DA408_06245 [Bacteroidota bacterium]